MNTIILKSAEKETIW